MASDIEWTKSPGTVGETWEVTIGCTAVSPGCTNCYAAELVGRRLGRNPCTPRYHGLAVIDPNSDRAKWTGDVALQRDALEIPTRTRKPTTYFVCSRSDLFHDKVPSDYIGEVFEVARACADRHRFIFLTKRADRLAAHATYLRADTLPESICVGVSVETQVEAHRLEALHRFGNATRMVSLEPLLGRVRLGLSLASGLSWAIIGGESGRYARPCHVEHVLDLVGELDTCDVPVFTKQLGRVPMMHGGKLVVKHPRGGDRDEWPIEVRSELSRGEFPVAWCRT